MNKYLQADRVCSSGIKIIFRMTLLFICISFSVTYDITFNKSDFSHISDITIKYIPLGGTSAFVELFKILNYEKQLIIIA